MKHIKPRNSVMEPGGVDSEGCGGGEEGRKRKSWLERARPENSLRTARKPSQICPKQELCKINFY